MNDFRLIETMRVSDAGEVCLLERHIDRLSRSADYFSFTLHRAQLRDEIRRALPQQASACCLRLELSNIGAVSFECRALPVRYARRLKLSTVRVNSNDVFLYHKTTNRGIYELVRQECDDDTDAILVNEHGEITETTIMNIAVSRDGLWITPQVTC